MKISASLDDNRKCGGAIPREETNRTKCSLRGAKKRGCYQDKMTSLMDVLAILRFLKGKVALERITPRSSNTRLSRNLCSKEKNFRVIEEEEEEEEKGK